MDENNTASPSPSGLACDVVTALDKIFSCLMTLAPAEDVGPDIPLSFSEVRAAISIPATGYVSMRMLADAIGTPLSTATHVVDRLVAKGVVVRIRPEHDRRLVLVELSERSKTHRQLSFRRRVEATERILDPLGPAQRKQIARALDEIAKAASSHVAAVRHPSGESPGQES